MANLVQKLRWIEGSWRTVQLANNAASEIERLRARLAEAKRLLVLARDVALIERYHDTANLIDAFLADQPTADRENADE